MFSLRYLIVVSISHAIYKDLRFFALLRYF